MDRSFHTENQIQRERLAALVARLSESDLVRPLAGGWTGAALLAHLAFWDRRALILLEQFEREGKASPRNDDEDTINDAMQTHCLAIPPRVAAQLAVESAEAIDRKLESASDKILESVIAAGHPFNLTRWEHRREHLDEIEHALAIQI